MIKGFGEIKCLGCGQWSMFDGWPDGEHKIFCGICLEDKDKPPSERRYYGGARERDELMARAIEHEGKTSRDPS